VFFLHGIGGNRRHWDAQLAFFRSRYRAAAWDARGYGDSDDYDGPLEFSTFSADLVRVLDHLGAGSAHVVGLSMGGRIARDFALRHPERVRSLILANTSPGFGALSADEVQAFLAARRAPLLAGRTPAELAPELARKLAGPRASHAALDAIVDSISRLHKESYLKTLEASVTQDRAAPVENLRMPALVITSEHDRLYPPPLARAMAARIPGAELVEIPGAGHLSNLEQPGRFNAALSAFLERLRS
jgi:3-oxoadipate enol-lactonase